MGRLRGWGGAMGLEWLWGWSMAVGLGELWGWMWGSVCYRGMQWSTVGLAVGLCGPLYITVGLCGALWGWPWVSVGWPWVSVGQHSLILPAPDLAQKFLAAELVPREAPLPPEPPLHHHLRGDAGVVAARVPQRRRPPHTVPVEHGVGLRSLPWGWGTGDLGGTVWGRARGLGGVPWGWWWDTGLGRQAVGLGSSPWGWAGGLGGYGVGLGEVPWGWGVLGGHAVG